MSLALYGICCLIHDAWRWGMSARYARGNPSTSFILVVKNLDLEIEWVIRCIEQEIEKAGVDCDLVVVDCGSNDLTPSILEHMKEESDVIEVLHVKDGARPVAEALPLCRGAVVHILDLANRLNGDECKGAVRMLLSRS